MPVDPYYYESKLRDIQGQRALTTGRALSPEENTAILNAELEARYAGEDRRRQLQIQEQQLKIQQQTAKQQGEAAKTQAIGQGVGGVGQLALGGTATYMMGKQAGWWGAKAAPAATPAIPSGGFGTTPGQVPVWGGVPGTGGVPGPVDEYTATTAGTGTGSELTLGTALTTVGAGALGSMIGQALPIGKGKETQIFKGAIGGAIAGAEFGSVGGPIGAIIGFGVGGATAALSHGTVICTELHRQGYMPKIVLMYDHEYRLSNIDEDAYAGYRRLADPVVRLMRRSKVFTWIVKPFGLGVAYECAHRANPDIKGSKIGSVILKYGLPLCRWVARRGYRWPLYYKA